MKRREKRLLDHARYKATEERGDTPDKKLKDLSDLSPIARPSNIYWIPKGEGGETSHQHI